MAIVQKMRSELAPAMKARDAAKTAFLRYWIAQLTLGTGAEMSDAEAIKKMRSVLKEAKSDVTTFTPEEIDRIREWVPASLSIEQIEALLAHAADAIRSAPKEGQALGIAMKALSGQIVETEDVRSAVERLRVSS